MKLFKKSLQIGFVLALSSIFVYCTGNTNKADNDKDIINDNDITIKEADIQLAPHTYDITLTNGDETIHYTGSVDMGGFIPSLYVDDGKNYVGDSDASVITLTLEDSPDFTIDALFALDKKRSGITFPIKQGRQSEGIGSTLRLIDHKADRTFTGVSGTAVFYNIERYDAPGIGKDEDLASYKLDFKGEFDLLVPETEEYIRYAGTGKVFIGAPL